MSEYLVNAVPYQNEYLNRCRLEAFEYIEELAIQMGIA